MRRSEVGSGAFNTVRELLQVARWLHENATVYYRTCRQAIGDRRLEMLLLRLEEEEHVIDEAIARYLTEAGSATLDLLCPPAPSNVVDKLEELTKKSLPGE